MVPSSAKSDAQTFSGAFSILRITQQTGGEERSSGGTLKLAQQEGCTETILTYSRADNP